MAFCYSHVKLKNCPFFKLLQPCLSVKPLIIWTYAYKEISVISADFWKQSVYYTMSFCFELHRSSTVQQSAEDDTWHCKYIQKFWVEDF